MEHGTNKFINLLIEEKWLKTPEIIRAFKKIKREDFLPEDMKNLAELNEALPIAFGQTISQPLTVAFMLELLQPKAGDKILDVGAGSGWTTALLAHIVSQKGISKSQFPISKKIPNLKSQNPNGKVVAMEIIPELAEFGEKNIAKYGFIEKKIIKCVLGDGSKGFKKEAPYDKILVSASGKNLPEALKEQLKIGGRLVCPIQNSIWLFIKNPPAGGKNNEFQQKEYPGFVFVPLVHPVK